MSNSVNAIELVSPDALVGSSVKGMSKSNCQSVSVVKSGQGNALESATLLKSVNSGAWSKL